MFDPNIAMDNSFTMETTSGIKSEIAKLDADSDHTSPIKSLPNEILAEIFVHALHSLHPPSPDMDTPTFGDASLGPVRQMRGCFLRVCRQWRRTSISEPRLWQVVKLTIGWPSLEADACHHIQDRIAWAGSLDFHLLVYHRKSSASINDDQAFKILCGLLPRLLSLHVRLEEGLVIAPIQLNDPPAMYSNLQYISVEASGYPEARGWCKNLLSHTPEVVWLDLPTPDDMSYSINVLSNLRFLSLREAESDDIVTILGCASRLLSLHVESIPYSDGMPSPTGIIQSQLSHLHINFGELASFLPHVTLPALSHLTFRIESDWPTHEILDFFDRSQCKLVTLEAQTVYAEMDSSISRIMETQETLTTLCFSPHDFYNVSAVPDAFISCLAKLPRLAVCDFTIDSSQIQALQDALSARLKAQKASEVVRMEDWVVTIAVESSRETNCDAFDGIVNELSKSGSNLRVKDGRYDSDSSSDDGYY